MGYLCNPPHPSIINQRTKGNEKFSRDQRLYSTTVEEEANRYPYTHTRLSDISLSLARLKLAVIRPPVH